MTCRDEILDCFSSNEIIKKKFSIEDIMQCMKKKKTKYTESTIRTHITSRMCDNAPDNHNTTYDDFIRTDDGYMLKYNKSQEQL